MIKTFIKFPPRNPHWLCICFSSPRIEPHFVGLNWIKTVVCSADSLRSNSNSANTKLTFFSLLALLKQHTCYLKAAIGIVLHMTLKQEPTICTDFDTKQPVFFPMKLLISYAACLFLPFQLSHSLAEPLYIVSFFTHKTWLFFASLSYKITATNIQSSALSHVTELNQVFVAGDSKLVNDSRAHFVWSQLQLRITSVVLHVSTRLLMQSQQQQASSKPCWSLWVAECWQDQSIATTAFSQDSSRITTYRGGAAVFKPTEQTDASSWTGRGVGVRNHIYSGYCNKVIYLCTYVYFFEYIKKPILLIANIVL